MVVNRNYTLYAVVKDFSSEFHVGVKSLIDLPLTANESSKIEAQG